MCWIAPHAEGCTVAVSYGQVGARQWAEARARGQGDCRQKSGIGAAARLAAISGAPPPDLFPTQCIALPRFGAYCPRRCSRSPPPCSRQLRGHSRRVRRQDDGRGGAGGTAAPLDLRDAPQKPRANHEQQRRELGWMVAVRNACTDAAERRALTRELTRTRRSLKRTLHWRIRRETPLSDRLPPCALSTTIARTSMEEASMWRRLPSIRLCPRLGRRPGTDKAANS